MRLLGLTVALDHVYVLSRVSTAIIGLFGDLSRCVSVPIRRRLLCPCDTLSILYVRLRRDGLRGAAAAHTAHRPTREHLHLLEPAASTTHRIHLFEHAAPSEAASKTATEPPTEEVVIVVIEHAEASERISAPLLLLLTSATLSCPGAHPPKVIVKEVLKGVTPPEKRPKDVIRLRKREVGATASPTPSKALEEGRLATETASSAASSTLLEALLAILVEYLLLLWVGKHRVRLADLLEHLGCGLLVVGVFVL